MISVTVVTEREIAALGVLHTHQNEVWINNGTLTLYDVNFEEQKTFNMLNTLYDMALTASQEIIATDVDNKRVVKISALGDVSPIIDTAPFTPHGICINKRHDIVMGLKSSKGSSSKRLAIYSSDGSTLLQAIENGEDGKPLFVTYITQVKQIGNGDYVVADGRRVVCVSSEGKFRWIYRTGASYPIMGLEHDKYDNIIIAEYGSNTINLLSSEGKLVSTLLNWEHGIRNPQSLSIDRHGQLWIGHDIKSLKVVKYLK